MSTKFQEKTFAIVDESVCPTGKAYCSCVHWICPFCNFPGSLDMSDHEMPEYFSVVCDTQDKVFLVRRATNEDLGGHGEDHI